MRALIVDDEPMPAKRLASLINKYCFEVKEVELFNRASKALERIEETHFDLIFLDVEMPEMSGFDFLEQTVLPRTTQVIVTTAYEKYAVKAFNIDAVHYLMKPVKKEDLVNGIRKAIRLSSNNEEAVKSELLQAEEKNISVFYQDEYYIVGEKEIIRLEADSSYTNLILSNKKLLSSKGLKHFEEVLTKGVFFRCHNSHIINVKQVEKYGKGRGGYVQLVNGDVIPISFSKKAELIKLLGA